jgi:hypothetical protein
MDRAIASGAIGREFESLRAHQISRAAFVWEILRCAQDFGCGLPLRSRPQDASSSNLSGRTRFPEPLLCGKSFAALRISAAGSRCAHARKTPQVRISPGAPDFPSRFCVGNPSLRSGFRLRAPAALMPAKRLKFESLRAHHPNSRSTRFRRARALPLTDVIPNRRIAAVRNPLSQRPPHRAFSTVSFNPIVFRSALNFRAATCSGEKPRSSNNLLPGLLSRWGKVLARVAYGSRLQAERI